MKKQLLLGLALFSVISALPQNNNRFVKAQAEKKTKKYQSFNAAVESGASQAAAATVAGPSPARPRARTANTSAVTSWHRQTGSENIYGMVNSNSKPVQYNDELGRISFIHRKSHTYITNPLPLSTASTGVIVADVSNDWGLTWDSTALWSNNTNWGRYPTGGIFNTTPTNTNASQAYLLGSGPVTGAAQNWLGNWYASKQMDCWQGAGFNNAPSTAPGAQQFIANTGTGTNTATGPGKVDFSCFDFAYTDDGSAHVLGKLYGDVNGTMFSTQLNRGARVLKATFSAATGTFTWSGDSIIFPAVHHSDGHPMLISDPHMAWKEDGSVGYVFAIGCRTNAIGSNRGNQPIVFKTTDHGATWNIIPSIDFNSSAMSHVLHSVPSVSLVPSLTIPFFNTDEDIDGTVDMNGNLHIMATIKGTSAASNDSLNFSFSFPNSVDGETYSYGHTPGARPYIYDFVGDGIGPWKVITVDSMSSESPGWAQASDDGYSSNTWDIDPQDGKKVPIDARMQMSRTPDGKYIVYTWAESDSATTPNSVKWNVAPNIKARMLDVSSMTLHPNKLSITDPANINDADPEVRGFAYNHYASTKCALSTNAGPGNVALYMPMTVSNNSAMHQLEPINHYFSAAILNFDNVASTNAPMAPDYGSTACAASTTLVGIQGNHLNSASSSVIYPNPAKGNATLRINLNDNSAMVNITITNIVGQQVKTIEAPAQQGENTINVDLGGLTKGIYIVNVKAGTAVSTKKLIVE